MTEILTLAEAAEKLRISAADPVRKVKRLIQKHGTPYRLLGAQWVLTEADLNALVNACCRSEKGAGSGMSAAASESGKKRRILPSIARERLTERLRKVTERSCSETQKPSSCTGPRLSVVK